MKYVILLLVFSTALPFKAQETSNFKIEYGSIFKNDKREIPIDIVGKDDSGYYLLYSEGRFGQGDDMNLRKFNLDLTPSGNEINLKKESYDGEFRSLGLNKFGDKITHIFYLLNDTGKTYYHQSIDLNSFSLGPEKKITHIENDTKKASNSVSRFLISDDEQTITLFYTIPNKNKEHTKFVIQKFDTAFNSTAKQEYELPYNNNVLSLQNIFDNADNELFLISKKYNSDKILKEIDAFGYEFLIHQIKADGLSEIGKIKPDNVHLRSLTPTLIDNNLLLTGIYSKTDMYAMSGIFASKFNLDSKTMDYARYNEFSSDFFTQLMEDGKRKDRLLQKFKQGKRDNQNYILNEVSHLGNGELLITAEQKRSYSYNYSITYYNDNIAAIKLNSEGQLVWANKIGKKQERGNVAIYSSYFSTLRNDKFLMFYNGNASNIGKTKGKFENGFNTPNAAFICTSLDSKAGSYKREKLFSKSDINDITIRPSLYNWEDENTLVLFGQDVDNLKNQRFIKIKFND